MKDEVLYRHRKRGSTYHVVGSAILQSSNGPIKEGESLMVYQCLETDQIWVRPMSEFLDGRFEIVDEKTLVSELNSEFAEMYRKE